jgi:hypothetical protein
MWIVVEVGGVDESLGLQYIESVSSHLGRNIGWQKHNIPAQTALGSSLDHNVPAH